MGRGLGHAARWDLPAVGTSKIRSHRKRHGRACARRRGRVARPLGRKLELPGYFSSAVISACGITDRHEPEKVLVKKMKLQVNRNAPFVAISVAAPTATQAEACIAAVIVEIAKRQDEISRPIIVAKQTELADLKIRIETTRAQKNIALNLLLASQRQRQLTGFEAMWMSTATKQEVKLRELIKRTPELEILLTSPLTQPTKLLSPIYAPEVRASMSPWLLLSLSLAAGVLLALVVLVLRVKLPEDNRS